MVQVIIECYYLSEIAAVLTGIKPQGTDNSYRMPGVARSGKDYLMWRVMILIGARIGEALG